MILNKRRTRRFEKMFMPIVSIALFTLTGCTSKQQSEISIYYTPESGEYIQDVLGLHTDKPYDPYELPFETLEEAEAKGKIILTLADAIGGSLSDMVDAFNCENEKYHIEKEIFPSEERTERQNRLMMEVSAGKGPDLMTYSALPNASKIMDKGCFVDLAPLMEMSGIKDEYFFPCYKALTYEDHVYGLSPKGSAVGRAVKEDVIGGKEIPSFEEFVDDVLYYPNDAVLINDTQKPEQMVDYFLEGSENLWGMIDWNEKTCNFDCDLFYKILEIVKRYSDARNKGFSPIMKNMWLQPGVDEGKEYFEKEGFVTIDFWFDDGNYPLSNPSFSTLMINSNTENLEGAWAFISFCLSETGQSYEEYNNPVNKVIYDKVFEDAHRFCKNEEEAEKYYPFSQIEDHKDLLERGKFVPYKTEPIINIIEEEAGAYWSGSKSIEDVVDIIQNRVSVFLKE